MSPSTQHTLCIVGADDALQMQIAGLIEQQAHRLLGRWLLADRAEADLLLVDTDSIHGHMDWLREKSNGRLLVACTAQADSHRDELVLPKPIQVEALAAVLNRTGARLATTSANNPPAAAAEEADTKLAPESSTATPAPRRLLDLLDAPSGTPMRLQADGLPPLWLDPATRTWHSPSTLKGLSAWATHELADGDIQHDAADSPDGETQPFTRLQWLCHLVGHTGQFEPGLDAAASYRLARWPQSEREFPRHFRIATVMLKEAATAEEIAARSGAPAGDVADFINAYHAIGYIDIEGAPAPTEGTARGLFGRIRKSSTN